MQHDALKNRYDATQGNRTVINLSSINISDEAKQALSKGLNFAPTPRKIPIESIIVGVEDAIVKNSIPSGDAECLRQNVAVILRGSKLPKPNIKNSERLALRSLKNNPDLLILPADKGNATVIVNTAEYEQKIGDLVSDSRTYTKVNYNPTTRVTNKLNKLLSSLPDDLVKSLRPPNPTPPKIYGLPKIHKPDWPLRPIVSQIDSPTYRTARFLADLLLPYTSKTSSYVKDSTHFTQLLEGVVLDEQELMVSFDVTSLFTNVPIEDTITIISELLSSHSTPIEYIHLIDYTLKSGFFMWRGDFYIQKDGVAMGSPIAPVVANIFMEWFERTTLESIPCKPRHWWRYVDDVFAIINKNSVTELLDVLNNKHPRISFTVEVEHNGELPFLDVLVKRGSNGHLTHTVYRKTTHTDRYLRADSHHHPAHIASVPRALINRALRLCDPQYIEAELTYVRGVLENNGYNWRHSFRIANASNRARVPTVDRATMYLPYIKGVTDKIGHWMRRKHDIKTIFRPVTQLRGLLRSPKDADPLGVPGVYKIPCDCGRSYIGETKRNVTTRLTEHIRAVKNLDVNRSAVAEHASDSDTAHFIRFDKTRVLAREKYYIARKIREAIEISRYPNFNRDGGWTLPSAWKPCLEQPSSGGVMSTSREDTVSSFCVQLMNQSRTTPGSTDSSRENSPSPIQRETSLLHREHQPSARALRAMARAARSADSAGRDAVASASLPS